ncbi:uncharacterized protein F5891DRAFT_982076 [Suillus fuscotomentosus]|uniref:Uncharacterized protein n=1 Tax=Suillus fuscotomentosus TaxID=1912939 RepID=A0AAD4E1W2_9AGAM|nr:uncharacterized protein F5891DRAFT_982076 [Suillus fuscotomentosus]KAG1898176.1 hypothetical protein F5891DRAFT_982076 [Suillus fuscotomentosus]
MVLLDSSRALYIDLMLNYPNNNLIYYISKYTDSGDQSSLKVGIGTGMGNPCGSRVWIPLIHPSLCLWTLTGFANPTITPSMFCKRVSKLTEKAAQAIAEGGQKLKQKVSTGSQETLQAKKAKNVPLTSKKAATTSRTDPSTSEDSTIQAPVPRVSSQRATVQTEEEDNASLANAIVVESSDTSSDMSIKAPESDAEASDNELGKSPT